MPASARPDSGSLRPRTTSRDKGPFRAVRPRTWSGKPSASASSSSGARVTGIYRFIPECRTRQTAGLQQLRPFPFLTKHVVVEEAKYGLVPDHRVSRLEDPVILVRK